MSSSEGFMPVSEEPVSSFSEKGEPESESDFQPKSKKRSQRKSGGKRKAASQDEEVVEEESSFVDAKPKKSKKKKTPTKKSKGKAKGKGKKKAVKAVSDSVGEKMILTYMAEQNRPFNSIMLSQNLHNEVKKTQAVRLLAKLEKAGKLDVFVNKKQLIYWINQDGLETASTAELRKMDLQIKELKEEIKELDVESKELKVTVRDTKTTPSDEQLAKQIPETEKRIQRKKTTRKRLEATMESFDPKKRDALSANLDMLAKEHSKRRRAFRNALQTIEDNIGKKFDWEEMGFETDEENKYDPAQLSLENIKAKVDAANKEQEDAEDEQEEDREAPSPAKEEKEEKVEAKAAQESDGQDDEVVESDHSSEVVHDKKKEQEEENADVAEEKLPEDAFEPSRSEAPEMEESAYSE